MTYNLDTACIMMILIDFKKIGKIWRKILIFWPKICIFFNCRSDFSLAVFGEKFMHFQENGPIRLIFCINVPWGIFHKVGSHFFIFGVLVILWVRVCAEGAFFSQNWPKKPPLHITGPVKWPKHQIWKNGANYCGKYSKDHLYKKLGKLDHFSGNV